MAVIGSIRKRVGLLIGFIGISMILFIVGGDILMSNQGLLGGNTDVVCEIGGKEIHNNEYDRRVEKLTENYQVPGKN